MVSSLILTKIHSLSVFGFDLNECTVMCLDFFYKRDI